MLSYQRVYFLLLTMIFLVGCGGEDVEGDLGNCEGGTLIDVNLVRHEDLKLGGSPGLSDEEYTSMVTIVVEGESITAPFVPEDDYIVNDGRLQEQGEWEKAIPYGVQKTNPIPIPGVDAEIPDLFDPELCYVNGGLYPDSIMIYKRFRP